MVGWKAATYLHLMRGGLKGLLEASTTLPLLLGRIATSCTVIPRASCHKGFGTEVDGEGPSGTFA